MAYANVYAMVRYEHAGLRDKENKDGDAHSDSANKIPPLHILFLIYEFS